MASEKTGLIQIWLLVAVSGAFGPAASEVDAAGVPAPAVSSVEDLFSPCQPQDERWPQRRHRKQPIPDSPRQCSDVGTHHFSIPVVAGAPLREEFQQLDLARACRGFRRCAFGIYRHK